MRSLCSFCRILSLSQSLSLSLSEHQQFQKGAFTPSWTEMKLSIELLLFSVLGLKPRVSYASQVLYH
jgi:hypothetical protein